MQILRYKGTVLFLIYWNKIAKVKIFCLEHNGYELPATTEWTPKMPYQGNLGIFINMNAILRLPQTAIILPPAGGP